MRSIFALVFWICCQTFDVKGQVQMSDLRARPSGGDSVEHHKVDTIVSFWGQKIAVLYGTRQRKHLTGAVSSVSGADMTNVPGSNRLNAISGRLAGYATVQEDGMPGYENSNFKVRGEHTFGVQRVPQVLIDGRPNVITMLDPYDIESVTILKDAASTVLYGLRSANGIILVNTKKGSQGRTKIDFNTQTTFQMPTRLPKFLNALQYATLYNEALLNDNPQTSLHYNNEALEAYRTETDPYRYPNVNWVDEFLKESSRQTRNSINISGGGKSARYFISGTYLSDNGLFNIDKEINTYNTNSNINVLGTHSNVEVNINKDLKLFADFRAKKDKRNAPGAYSRNYDESVFASLYATPFNAHPIKNADGSIGGTTEYRSNPYAMLNHRGYSVWEETSLAAYANAAYNLSGTIKGLSLLLELGFTNVNQYYINRNKTFEVSQLNPNGTSYTRIGTTTSLGNTGVFDYGERFFDHAASINYSNVFGQHSIDAMLRYDRQQIERMDLKDLSQNFQGPKGSFSYAFKRRYIADFAFSVQGNERYPDNNRYGFFPAVSAAWILSEENFLKSMESLDFLKLRTSWGITGNHINNYFDYLSTFAISGSAAVFGTSPSGLEGYYQSKIANPALTWEKCMKINVGLDVTLLKNRFTSSIDYFSERNRDILIRNAITAMYGATIDLPEGKFGNRGVEVEAQWNDKAGNLEYFLGANFSRTRNIITYQNETPKEYASMYSTGNPLGTRYGYVFDRFFTEEDNFNALPDQSLLGVQHPGDLKYKDLNDDGLINEYDIARIGYAKMPEINYGINMGMKFKGLDLSLLFHGTANSTTYNSGPTYWEFVGRTGNVLEHHLERWRPGAGQAAGYPRLTLSNTNNFVASSYWVSNNSFLRLKYMELGYSIPSRLSRKVGLQNARVFLNGNNLYLWDSIEHKDPEIEDTGLVYPLQRAIGIGLNLKFN